MKKLMIVTAMFLKIACVGYSQTDTICLTTELAIKKLRQADSLQIAKKQIAEQKVNISTLNQRVFEKDTTIGGLKKIISLKDDLIGSKDREIGLVNEKVKTADDRGDRLNKKLKRANTRTIFGTIIGVAIPVIIAIIKNSK